MCSLSEKDVKFNFDELCLKAFEMLKLSLVEAPILIGPEKYHLNLCVMLVM